MTRIQSTAAAVSLLAELSHIFCCGLPVLVAVLSVGSQIGLGGGFLAFHALVHNYEVMILAGSGLLLALGLALHYVSFRINCRATGCAHDDCEPVKFRVGWIFAIALVLYCANIAFFVLSGHGAEPPRFT